MNGELCDELSGELIIARVRGEPTVELPQECQSPLVRLAPAADPARAVYDTLEMDPPRVDVPWSHRALDEQLGDLHLRRAIVVPTSKLAYLARLAFGEGAYRVFYNDTAAAVKWLTETPLPARLTRIK